MIQTFNTQLMFLYLSLKKLIRAHIRNKKYMWKQMCIHPSVFVLFLFYLLLISIISNKTRNIKLLTLILEFFN